MLAIAGTNVRRMLRDRSNIFFVFLLPLLLILVIGAIFGGSFQPRVGVAAEASGPITDALIDELQASEAIRVLSYDTERDMLLAVERGELEAGVIVPTDLESAVRHGAEILYVSRELTPETRAVVEAAVQRQNSVLRAAAFVAEQGLADFDQALELARTRRTAEIAVDTESVGEPFPLASLGQFDLGAQSQLILFMFLTSLTGSAALIQSRKLGVTRRMFSTPTSTSQIIIGEALGRIGVALIQGVFIVVGTALIFGVDWGDPWGTGGIVLVFAVIGAGAAMVLGSLFRNDEQAGGIGVLLGLGLGALGGCMVPLQIIQLLSPTLYDVAHITPHAWALEAFVELVQRGGGLADILPELGILSVYAAGLLALAVVLLRRTITR